MLFAGNKPTQRFLRRYTGYVSSLLTFCFLRGAAGSASLVLLAIGGASSAARSFANMHTQLPHPTKPSDSDQNRWSSLTRSSPS